MRDYLVASLKMTPANPTFTEARDAVLATAFAADPDDHALFCAAFAKRGVGTTPFPRTVFPTRTRPVVESFECSNLHRLPERQPERSDGLLRRRFVSGQHRARDAHRHVQEHRRNDALQHDREHQLHESQHLLLQRRRHDVPAVGSLPDHDGHDRRVDGRRVRNPGLLHRHRRATTPTSATPIPVSHLDVRGNANDVANSSTNDNVEARLTPWSTAGSTNGTWVRQQLLPSPPTLPPPPFNYAWHAPDQGDVSDIRLDVADHSRRSRRHYVHLHASLLLRGHVRRRRRSRPPSTTEPRGMDIGAANLSPTYAAAPLVAGQPARRPQGLHRQQHRLSGAGHGHGDPRRRVREPRRSDSFPRCFGRRRRRPGLGRR